MMTRPSMSCNSFYFYIKPQPSQAYKPDPSRCNSFYFYIKPQLSDKYRLAVNVVIHSISTSNHNVPDVLPPEPRVVIHSISTSNHNMRILWGGWQKL